MPRSARSMAIRLWMVSLIGSDPLLVLEPAGLHAGAGLAAGPAAPHPRRDQQAGQGHAPSTAAVTRCRHDPESSTAAAASGSRAERMPSPSHGGGLAGPVRPQQGDHLAPAHLEVD